MRRLSTLGRFLSILTLIPASCTSASYTKTEYFAEYPASGAVETASSAAFALPNYYRVTSHVHGANGQVDYRSGWYDAQAVDSLFGDISSLHSLDALTNRRRVLAVKNTLDVYLSALEAGEAQPALATKLANYQSALDQLFGVGEIGKGRAGLVDTATKKFVMIFSNDPSKVLEAIKGRVQQMQMANTLGGILEKTAQREAGGEVLLLTSLASTASLIRALLEDLNSQLTAIQDPAADEVALALRSIDDIMEASK